MPLLRHGPRRFRPAHPRAPRPLDNEASGLSMQLDLVGQLRLIQENEYRPVGATQWRKVNLRIIAATHRELKAEVAAGRFRLDLYYRLNVFPMRLPALRDRKDEIPTLLRHFMTRFAESYARSPLSFSPALLEECQRNSWPGNLRELSNFVKRYLILGDEAWAIHELRTGASISEELSRRLEE